LANNQIVAAIKISRDTNRELRDRTTREGLVKNEAYSALMSWFIEVLKEIESYRYDVRPREQKDTTKDPLFEAFDIRDTVNQARTALGSDHQVAALITQMERQVNEGVERVQEVFSRLLMSAGLGQMVDIVIHEIGAPIGKINRQIEVLERTLSASSDAKLTEVAVPMILSIKGWLEQVHNLRQRLDPQTAGRRGRASRFNVQDEVEDTFRLYGALLEGQGISWTIKHLPDEIQVSMARAALGQVLANLVDNAIKYSEAGGVVRVEAHRTHRGVEISVADHGIGIPSRDLSRIFERFYRVDRARSRSTGGTGLGLSIVRHVATKHGGRVKVRSVEGEGSTFTLILPDATPSSPI